jgi:hypothetical protein
MAVLRLWAKRGRQEGDVFRGSPVWNQRIAPVKKAARSAAMKAMTGT